MHRSHVDKGARALLVHILDTGLGGEKRAVEMDRHQLLPIGKRKLLYGMHDLDARVRDEDVDLAKCRRHLIDAGVDLLFVGDIHRHGDGEFFVAKLPGCGGRGLKIEICNRHLAAGADIALGDLVPDAARGAGNERNFSVDIHFGRSFASR